MDYGSGVSWWGFVMWELGVTSRVFRLKNGVSAWALPTALSAPD